MKRHTHSERERQRQRQRQRDRERDRDRDRDRDVLCASLRTQQVHSIFGHNLAMRIALCCYQ